MSSVVFVISGVIMVGVMVGVSMVIGSGVGSKGSAFSPLESGLATVGKTYCVFSVQMFMVLVLFLVFDLEIIFVVSLVFGGSLSVLSSGVFMGFVLLTLWAEWEWGKLYWAI